MKLTKSIEVLTFKEADLDKWNEADLEAAIKLLIEAGQRIQVGRNNPGTHWNDLLPGEDLE